VFVGDVFLGVAQPAGMREGDHLYTLVVTLIGKAKEISTTVPKYAGAEIQLL